MMGPQNRIIVALDYSEGVSALALVDALGDSISFYKVGLQLFASAGAEVVRQLKVRKKRVFLDLKFHDIPNTVAGAVSSISKLGVDLLTIHASGGIAMMKAAVKAARDAEHPATVLAVTVLTSMDAMALRATNVQVTPAMQVLHLAKLAKDAGCGGIVCSAEEITGVRPIIGPEMKLVVPGIRPAGSASGDQVRMATPAEAVSRGADYLVIGRPITAALDPRAAVRAILDEASANKIPAT
jgi:orotidine-5'-phosphate decarboxylase